MVPMATSKKPVWIGLFRGVNVGGNNKLPMKELPKLLESDEIRDVRTYIASGNLLFRSNLGPLEIEKRIGDAIEGEFGFRPPFVPVILKRLEKLIANNPYCDREAQGKGQHFFFLKAPAKSADLDLLHGLKAEGEEFSLTNEVFYLYAPAGVGRSKLVAKIDRAIQADMTARNLNTVMTLRDLAKAMFP
jgi:uncharacterized protein (DUF1697 family)